MHALFFCVLARTKRLLFACFENGIKIVEMSAGVTGTAMQHRKRLETSWRCGLLEHAETMQVGAVLLGMARGWGSYRREVTCRELLEKMVMRAWLHAKRRELACSWDNGQVKKGNSYNMRHVSGWGS